MSNMPVKALINSECNAFGQWEIGCNKDWDKIKPVFGKRAGNHIFRNGFG
jgi:hypothetical protein